MVSYRHHISYFYQECLTEDRGNVLNAMVLLLSSLSASALLTSTPRGVGPPVCVNTDGERRSEDLYLAAVPEERAVVAAVVVPLHLQVEAVLEGVVVGKLEKQ